VFFKEKLDEDPGRYERYVDNDVFEEGATEEHERYTELCRRADPVVSHLLHYKSQGLFS